MNDAMEELENAVIRQAESMGFEPGSDGFEALIYSKIINPENHMMRAVRGSKFKMRADQFIDSLDAKYVRYRFLKSLKHWCSVNRGMNLYHASQILNLDWQSMQSLGREGEMAGLGNFTLMLDGTDDRVYYNSHPDVMSEGCRGTVGSFNH